MKTISRALLSAMLACSVALAETAPSPPTPVAVQSAQSAQKKARRVESFKGWWLWSLVAVLSAGTIVTSVVIATVPRGSLNTYGAGTVAVTVRF